MSGHYQYNQDGSLYQSSSQHYSHPYAPNGEPSQPIRSGYGLPNLGTNGVENGPVYYQQPYPPPSPRSTPPPSQYEPTPRRSHSDIAPIPAPVIKTDYAAPVFQTFQERKRAKEQAMMAQGGAVYGYSPTRSSRPQVPPSPYGNGSGIVTPPERPVSASPLPHERPTSTGPHALPRPPSGSDVRQMPPPSIRTDLRPSTPGSPVKSTALPSPTVRPSSSRPLPSPIRTHSAPEAGPSTFRSPPPQSPVSPSILERSDTISSVKSLDRAAGFGSPSKRPLPKPPVAVVASKSLDRGLPSGIGAAPMAGLSQVYEKKTGRRLPSTVTEMSEGSEGDLSAEMGRMGLDSPTKSSAPEIVLPPTIIEPGPPTINVPTFDISPPSINMPTFSIAPPTIVEPHTVTPPTIIEPGSKPATFTPLPSINIEDDDGSGIVFAGLPTIAVSSFDTSDQPSSVPTSTHTPQPTRIDPTSAIVCTGCSNPIIGRIVSAMGQRWHPQCFMCGECGELLEHVSSYEFNGRPYCHLDYHDKFAHRCHHCKTPIVEPRFITLDDPILGQRFYHELHFFCSECGDPFLDPSRSSAPGTERTRSTDAEEEETNAFVIQKGHPYCERCHLRLHKPRCKGCKKPIPDVAVEAMGGKWHQKCFVCEECGNGFANSLFFPRDGKAFCTECYGTMVGS